MPSIFSRLMGAGRQSLAESKASRAGALLAMHSLGQPRWTQRTSTELTR